MKRDSKLLAEKNRKWWTLASVSFAFFMTMLDNTVVNVALPSIQKDLGISVSQLEWVVNGYILSIAVLMLSGGKLADMYGRRRIFMVGLAVFTVSSLLCGVAGSAHLLIAARVAQGGGAALMIPATLSIITATFPPAQRGAALGIWSSIAAVALASGPLIGGLLTEHVGWNWVFYINVPIGAIGLVVARFAILESRDTSHEQRLDLPGLATSAIALFALVYALIEGNTLGWASARVISLFTVALLSGITFIMLELRQRLPMLELTLFRNRTFAGANAVVLIQQFASFAVFVFISLYMQEVLGYSAIATGAAFLPWMLLLIVATPLAGRASDRFGSRWLMTGGSTLVALALMLFARLEPNSSYWSLFPAMLIAGAGTSMTNPPLLAAAMSSVPVDKAGVGSGIVNTFRQVGGALGIAVLGAIIASTSASSLAHGATQTNAFMSGLHHAFAAAAIVAALGALIAATTIRSHTEHARNVRR